MPTKIEWCDETWNPITGCSPISEGCEHCYAKRYAERFRGRFGYPADDPFRVTFHENKLDEPMHWKSPRKVFVCSMGDLFHEDVNSDDLDEIFSMIGLNPQHTFIVLTKRPSRIQKYLTSIEYASLICTDICWEAEREVGFDTEPDLPLPAFKAWSRKIYNLEKGLANIRSFEKCKPLPNLWLGVTAENQRTADERIPILLQTPAAKRFVSVEPMLGPVDLRPCDDFSDKGHGPSYLCRSSNVSQWPGLDWVICGGESGPKARPMHPDWVRDLRDQCVRTNTPFFFKQWGEYCAPSQMIEDTFRAWDYGHGTEAWDRDDATRWKVGKKAAGRLLDGREWNEWPEAKA